jgi:hypothetical protein
LTGDCFHYPGLCAVPISTMADLVDPTVASKYPVILSDSLLNGSRDDIFTGVRYNHKPTLSSDTAPDHARLKPSLPGDTSSYDLSFINNGGHYAYAGTRNFGKDQYVLYFSPERQAFILDRVESTFDMNLTRTPTNSDPASLGRKYPHLPKASASKLDQLKKESAADRTETAKRKPPTKSQAKSPLINSQPRRAAEKKKEPPPKKRMDLALPVPEAPKPKAKRKPAEEDEEDEEDDDDGGLLIEYPDAPSKAPKTDFSPAFPSMRRFDDFMDKRESEADDADGESGEDEYEDLKLPSPVSHQRATAHQDDPSRYQREPTPMDVDDSRDNKEQEGEDGDDLEKDLEKDLEAAFDLEKDMEMAFEGLNNGHDSGDESEISEED